MLRVVTHILLTKAKNHKKIKKIKQREKESFQCIRVLTRTQKRKILFKIIILYGFV